MSSAKKLNTAERAALENVAGRTTSDPVGREHLERLSRLDLIEPCAEGVCLTPAGKRAIGIK